MANVVEVAIRGIDEATKVFDEVGSTAEKSMQQAEASVNAVDESIQDVSNLDVDTGGTEEAMDSASDSIEGVQDSLHETEEVGESFGDKMKGVFASVADRWKEITAVAGIAGAGMEGFARSQGDVNATLERTSIATGDSTDSLRNMADGMSDHTFATEDAIGGMEMLVQRGIDTEDQFESILPQVNNLANATGQDFPEALESADNLLSPFGESLDDLGENTEQMSRIMQQTDIPLGSLERNLGRVPDELEGLGFGLDDASAGIEVFRDQGFEGKEAVREFRRAVDESDGDMNAFLDTMGLTNAEWEEYQAKVEPAVGLTDELADANNDQMTVMEKVQSTVENVMTKYSGFAEVLGLVAPLLIALGPMLKGVTMAMSAFNVVLNMNPIGLIVIAITSLIAIGILLWKNWDEVAEFLANTWEWIKELAIELFGGLGEYLAEFWDWISEIAVEVWTVLADFFVEIWDSIVEIFMEFTEWLGDILSTAWDSIVEVATTVWNGIADFFTAVWEAYVSIVEMNINTMLTVITTVFNFIKTVITTVWNAIKTVSSSVWDGIVAVVTAVISHFKGRIEQNFEIIKKVITVVWNTIKSVSSSVWNGIVSVVTGVINSFKGTISTVFNAIKNTISTVWNTVKSVSSSLWNGIKSTISGIINGISSTVSSVFNGISSTISGVWQGISNTTSSIWDGIVGSIKGAVNGVIGAINGMLNGLGNISISLPSVPDWVPGMGGKGGGTISFPSVPNIPSLATGGVVSAPTLAMVGDAGRGNPEIVAPQKMIAQIVGQELKKIFDGTDSPTDSEQQDIVIHVNIDGKEVAKVTAPHMDKQLGKRRKKKNRAGGG